MYYNKYDLVVFGASSGGRKVIQTLESLNYRVDIVLDNDPQKWDQTLENKLICNPDILIKKKDNYKIVIASEYQKEIEQQLFDMNVNDKLMLREELIDNYISMNRASFDYLKNRKYDDNKKRSIIIDLAEGYALGGIEDWSLFLATELKEQMEEVFLYSRKTNDTFFNDTDRIMKYFDLEYNRYKDNLQELADSLVSMLPCVVIINKHTQLQFAANIVKHYYPDRIKIISMVHGDNLPIYRRQVYLEKYFDAIFCVSRKIKETLENVYKIPANKLYYKESPVDYEKIYDKKYTLNSKDPVKIGYAGRLQKSQKRVDLLIPFICNMEQCGINYSMEIAGDGELLKILVKYIKDMKLENKIKFLGRLQKREMKEFWKKQDIFVNFSDCEGVGLSMLEAMSWGVVPIETCVAGSDEFIFERYNGYICNLGDVIGMVNAVYDLYINRNKIQEYGVRSRNIIMHKCCKQHYIKYFKDLFDDMFLLNNLE